MEEFIIDMITFLVTVAILNIIPIVFGSKMRFGWYEKGKG